MALSQNLRDIQRRLREAAPTGGAGGAAADQQQMQKLIRAKSGKASTAGGPKASALQAEGAGANIQAMAKEQALQGAMQAEQLGAQASNQAAALKAAQERLAAQKRMSLGEMGAQSQMAREQMAAGAERSRKQMSAQEEMKVNQMSSAFRQKLADMTTDKNIALDDIFANYDRSNQQLEFRKDAAELEQKAFDLDMANQQLLEEYQSIWAVQNLDNQLNFEREYAKIQMGEQTSMMIDQLGWQRAFDADERAFQEETAKMSIDQAIALADASLKDTQRQMIFQGVLTGVKGAASAWESDDSLEIPEMTDAHYQGEGSLEQMDMNDLYGTSGSGSMLS